MFQIAVLGYGVVGSGVVEVIQKNKNSIRERAGEEIVVRKILDIRDFENCLEADLLTKDPKDVFDDPVIDLVVETIGGASIAYHYTKRAFEQKKHVVSSNKELIASHGPELLQMAKDMGVSYFFEASVGGGIPIIRPLNQCLAANKIVGITGIINGTTNYILTKMRREGMGFHEALKGAQQNGYAEGDPTADVEGYDACRKIAILSSIAYNQFVDYRKIYTEGISKITRLDMEYAECMGYTIKLIALSAMTENGIVARVSPAFVPKENPLANVEDVFNAILVKGNAIGDAMFYGRGAGKLPTASAVVADIIDIAKRATLWSSDVWHIGETENVVEIGESLTRMFVRAETSSKDAIMDYVTNNFEGVEFVYLNRPEKMEEVAFVTANEKENVLSQKLAALKNKGFTKQILSTIRVLCE